jgi:hypothetical protein
VEEAFADGDWPLIERYGRFLDPILARISSDSPWKAAQIEQFRGKIPNVYRRWSLPLADSLVWSADAGSSSAGRRPA